MTKSAFMSCARSALLAGIALTLLSGQLDVHAQPAGAIRRTGFLSSNSATAAAPFFEAFRQGLRDLRWIEGKNIVIEHRFADGRFERLPDLAGELLRLKVDVIVAAPTPSAVAAKDATRTIPIVMVAAGDPVGLGLVASLARPGGNVTGLSFSVGLETVGKGLELLRETLPNVRGVAVLSNPANPSHALAIEDVKVTARSLGLQLQLLEARDRGELDAAFGAMAKERVGAVLVVPDALFTLHRAWLADLAAKNRLPAMYGIREIVEAGGLMSYGPSMTDLYRRAATYVDKIFNGAKPADLLVEQPTKFEFLINLKTAKALGLTIPASVRLRADKVIP